jgi:hypothetical protein
VTTSQQQDVGHELLVYTAPPSHALLAAVMLMCCLWSRQVEVAAHCWDCQWCAAALQASTTASPLHALLVHVTVMSMELTLSSCCSLLGLQLVCELLNAGQQCQELFLALQTDSHPLPTPFCNIAILHRLQLYI